MACVSRGWEVAGFSPLHPRNAFENARLRLVHGKGEKEAGIFDIARDRYSLATFQFQNRIPLFSRSLKHGNLDFIIEATRISKYCSSSTLFPRVEIEDYSLDRVTKQGFRECGESFKHACGQYASRAFRLWCRVFIGVTLFAPVLAQFAAQPPSQRRRGHPPISGLVGAERLRLVCAIREFQPRRCSI